MKTIFCDIDGTILKTSNGISKIRQEAEILPGVLENFETWNKLNYYVVLTTARPESLREFTKNQLANIGVEYDYLLMGLNNGERIVINDKSTEGADRAKAINLEKNSGLSIIR